MSHPTVCIGWLAVLIAEVPQKELVGRPTPSEKELVTRTSYSRVIEFQPLITQSSDHGTQHNLHSKHSSGSHLQYEIIRIIIECLIIALQSFFWVIVFNFPTISWSPLLGLHSMDFLSLIFYCLETYWSIEALAEDLFLWKNRGKKINRMKSQKRGSADSRKIEDNDSEKALESNNEALNDNFDYPTLKRRSWGMFRV